MAVRAAGLVCCGALLILTTTALDDNLQLNQLQVVATGHSFHKAPPGEVRNLLATPPFSDAEALNARTSDALVLFRQAEFTHANITQQLDSGVRGLELTVFQDPAGGRYAHSPLLRLAGLDGSLVDAALLQPGFKVFRQVDFDAWSNCYLLADCLREVRDWSAAHPGHVPITVVLHPGSPLSAAQVLGQDVYGQALAALRAATAPGPTNFTEPLPVDSAAAVLELEDALRDVFDAEALITPREVQGNASSLRQAVMPPAGRWPLVGDLRGRVMFVAGPGMAGLARHAHGNLTYDALLFLSAAAASRSSDVVFLDVAVDVDLALRGDINPNATAMVDEAAAAVAAATAAGFAVRTSCDLRTVEARFNYTYRRDALTALGSAHFMRTDYPAPPADLFPSRYHAMFPPRCNALTANLTGSPCWHQQGGQHLPIGEAL